MKKLPAFLLLTSLLIAQETTRPVPDWKKEFAPEDDSWKSVKQELIFNNGAEPETLDPGTMTGVPEHRLALGLYEGLASHDPETLQPRPGVAERWELSEDGKTYTFHLRKNAKWSNGEALVAEDFAWSYYRALNDPHCDYAYLFYYIDGAKAYHKATIASLLKTKKPLPRARFDEMTGVRVADPHTLVITLDSPTAYFLDLCAFETYMPVHRATVEKHGLRWTEPGHWVGNGPYILKVWSPRQHIIMTPNPHYWDAGLVKLQKITALPIQDADVAYNKFIGNEVHWIVDVPIARIDEARRKAEYFVMPFLGSYFYRFNVEKRHLSDKRIRQALSLAVNRETITRDVTRGGQIPATWFCPPIAGAAYEPAKGWAYDPDRARKLLKEGMAALDIDSFPKLTIYYNTSEDHKKVAERVAQMWKENLGIQVALQNNEWKVYLEEVQQTNYEVARAGWIGDYGDPMTFMDMWLKDGGNNNTNWTSPRYDELIEKARVEPDRTKRAAYFREAEHILIEDEFPILPLYIYINQGMKVEGLQGWYENVRNLHPFQYMYFEPE